jgi:hypothetical protein
LVVVLTKIEPEQLGAVTTLRSDGTPAELIQAIAIAVIRADGFLVRARDAHGLTFATARVQLHSSLLSWSADEVVVSVVADQYGSLATFHTGHKWRAGFKRSSARYVKKLGLI